MRIAIIGAGPTGLALTAALRRIGAHISLFEQRSHRETSALGHFGMGMGLWPAAVRALRSVHGGNDLVAALEDSGRVMPSAGYQSNRGEWLARPTADEHGHSRSPVLCVQRAELEQRLRAAAEPDAVHHGTTVDGLEPVGRDGVRLRVRSGWWQRRRIHGDVFDVVVAADGVWSPTREQLFGKRSRARFAGYDVVRGAVQLGDSADDDALLQCAFERWGGGVRVAFVPMADRTMFWYASVPRERRWWPLGRHIDAPDTVHRDVLGWLRGVMRERAFAEPVDDVLARTDPATLITTPIFSVPSSRWRVPRWHGLDGRVWLAGDAAHAVPPNLAQGACLGIEDAVEIGAQLASSSCDHPSGLVVAARRFEAARRRRADRVLAMNGVIATLGHMKSDPVVKVRNATMRIGEWAPLRPLAGRVFDGVLQWSLGPPMFNYSSPLERVVKATAPLVVEGSLPTEPRGTAVLVVGARGMFGSRVVEQLRLRGMSVVTAGRGGNVDVRVDATDADSLSAVLRARPHVGCVIHAAGPFRPGDYTVARTCVRLGVHYFDLADVPEFVRGLVRNVGAEAEKRGVIVRSGASSVPAVSWAVVEYLRKLQHERTRSSPRDPLPVVTDVRTAIVPGNRTDRGRATVASVLSMLGCEHTVLRNGKWTARRVWSGAQRLPALPMLSRPHRRRWTSRFNVPDVTLMPSILTGGAEAPLVRDSVSFRAGLELPLLHWGGVVLSQLLRFASGVLPGAAQRGWVIDAVWRASSWVRNWGSAEGGMLVEVTFATRERRALWIRAGSGDGPQTPAAASVHLVGRIDELAPGARPAVGEVDARALVEALRVDGFDFRAFERRAPAVLGRWTQWSDWVEWGLSVPVSPLYRRVMGRQPFDSAVPAALRAFHSQGHGVWRRTRQCTVERQTGSLFDQVVSVLLPMLPPAGSFEMQFRVDHDADDPGCEVWRRRFVSSSSSAVAEGSSEPEYEFVTRQACGALRTLSERVVERGPLANRLLPEFEMAVEPVADGFDHRWVRTRLWGVPLPAWAAPRVTATTRVLPDGGWAFVVQMWAPRWLSAGPLLAYRGEVEGGL